MKSSNLKTAEDNFRASFERLKAGTPKLLPAGSEVSQSNVALEADCVPSALRKSRFMLLVKEIQDYVTAHKTERPESERQKLLKQRQHNRSTKERVTDLEKQLGATAGLLVEANAQIGILTRRYRDAEVRMEHLQSKAKIIPLTKGKPKASPRDYDRPS